MQQIKIQLAPLTQQAFKPFGDVIEIEGANHFPINQGTVERHNDLGTVEIGGDNGRPLISIVTCNNLSSLPYTLPLIERHPLGSQAFIPMDNTPIVVAVAEPTDSPQPEQIKAFISNGYQGVNYHSNIWHMPMLFLDKDQRMIVVDRGGEGNNCDEFPFPEYEIIITE
ncbi:MAG: ureidoglycolate lyase [Leucothrix sp.]